MNDFAVDMPNPLLCLEVNPPKGTDIDKIFKRLEGNVDDLDFFNVTDSALSRMRSSPLPFASLLKERFGVDPLVNISCRDRNLIALQADLLAGWTTGIRYVVALTGDAVSVGDAPETKGVFEVNSRGLLKTISTLNAGTDLVGNKLNGSPDYCPGVVVNPNAKNPQAEIRRLNKKKEAGACYALSQPVFDSESAISFFKEASAVGVPILVGLMGFRSVAALKRIATVPGIRLTEEFEKMLSNKEDEDLRELSIERACDVARSVFPYVRGFHVVSGATPKLAMRLLSALLELRKQL